MVFQRQSGFKAADDLMVNGINQSFNLRNDKHRENISMAYPQLSEVLGNLNTGKSENAASISLRAMRDNDMSLYDVSNPQGHLSKWRLMDPTLSASAQPVTQLPDQQGNLVDWTLQDFMESLPNQIKALFHVASNPPRGSLPNGIKNLKQEIRAALMGVMNGGRTGGITNWDRDRRQRTGGRALVRYLFETIYRLEVFRGYQAITEDVGSETNPDKPSLVEFPWIPMTRQIYQEAIDNNKNLLCRLRPYNNDVVGIHTKNELPLFEEYFMLQPHTLPPRGNYQAAQEEDDFTRAAAEAEQTREMTNFIDQGATLDARLMEFADQIADDLEMSGDMESAAGVINPALLRNF